MNHASVFGKWIAVLGLAGLFCFASFAQTTPVIGAFAHEATLPFTSVGFAGTIEAPPALLLELQQGRVEIRQAVEWVAASESLRVRHFVVAPGTPLPAPGTAPVGVIDEYLVKVSQVSQYADPRSLVFTGMVERIVSGSPFGRIVGTPVIYSLGYDTSATPAQFNNVTLVLPGRLVTYIQGSTGTLTFGSTTGGGTGTPSGPTANAGPDVAAAQSLILLDGRASTGTGLSYSWKVVRGSAVILDPTAAQPRVQLSQGAGTYEFELTVKDSAGAESKDTVQIRYTGSF
jgi:hypothetical protein